MTQRYLVAFGGLFVLIIGVGMLMGAPFTVRLMVEAFAFALIAMGLNIQWGFGGLFNFGILGMLMVGGFAVTFISYPINPDFWGSGGPAMLGRTLIAAAIGAVLIVMAHRVQRLGITGKWRATVIVIAWFVAYIIFRSQMDPAARLIISEAGWVGGLGLPVVLGWAFGGVLAAIVAFFVGKVSLGLRTDYLAIATIGIAEILRAVIKNVEWLTRGTLTVSPIPWPVPDPLAFQAMGATPVESFIYARAGYLALVVAVVALALWLIHRAYMGPWGRMMRAIRDNHIAAGSMGKDVKGRQLEIFVFGSVLMGIGGAILVSFVQIFDPSSYQPIHHTFLIWVMLIVGGSGNNFGALFGGLFIYIIWILSEPLAQALFMVTSGFSEDMGWGAIPDIEARSVQMRVFVLGLVISIALRFAPRGLLPEVIKRHD
ncbi:branched-chain amino acid ABC transporter permease [Pelagibacterium xiamenense]|uniref:branched-chain amino acid ABC transporter permease n=1 Tax=Pelagibacterium xiamenense TaxID=2901140 RepID=UPI001E46DA84|nr:branched-chain amino acid ABC transporter permease [Pelagibacterium xiamenense]MCD7061339.1 branched-chain amino acid ABC transporter permease [Pelagibacterium xiamenense]